MKHKTKIVSITQFRSVAGSYLSRLDGTDIVITWNKIPMAVVVGIDRYKKMMDELDSAVSS